MSHTLARGLARKNSELDVEKVLLGTVLSGSGV